MKRSVVELVKSRFFRDTATLQAAGMLNQLSQLASTVFLAYLSKFFKPVQDLAKMTNTIAQTAIGLERIQTILAADDVIPERPGATDPPKIKGGIAFKNAWIASRPPADAPMPAI